RTVKITSPMSMGTWIVGGFASASGVLAALEVDEMTGRRVPLGAPRSLLGAAEIPASLTQVALAPALASYTAALLRNTVTPSGKGGPGHRAYPAVPSARLAARGAARSPAPAAGAGAARLLATAGVAGDVVSMHRMKARMHPLEAEPLEP